MPWRKSEGGVWFISRFPINNLGKNKKGGKEGKRGPAREKKKKTPQGAQGAPQRCTPEGD